MVVWKAINRLMSAVAAIQLFYWAIMFAGASLNFNVAPNVSPGWIALGFLGAAMLMTENLFPFLAKARVDQL